MSQAQEGPPILQSPQPIAPQPGVLPQAPPPGGPVPLPPGQITLPSNALANAKRAIETARQVKKLLSPGKVWMLRAPGGELILKAAILYQGIAIGVLEFSPTDGTLLPCGYHPRVFETTVSLTTITQKLPQIIAGLTVLDGAEYMELENNWVIPVAYDHKIVAHIKINYDGAQIVQDYPATQEMQMYGQ